MWSLVLFICCSFRNHAVDLLLFLSFITIAFAFVGFFARLPMAGVVDEETFTKYLSVLAPCCVMLSYSAAFPVLVDAVQRSSADNLPTLVFQSQAVCNILGIAYGIHTGNIVVVFANMFGLACQLIYLAMEHHLRIPRSNWISWTYWAMKLSLFFYVGLVTLTRLTSIDILGQLIFLFNVVLSLSPFVKIGVVLKNRDADCWPVGMTTIALLNNGLWILYALMLKDGVLLWPSVIGYLLATSQLIVIAWCRNALPFNLAFLLAIMGGEMPLDDDKNVVHLELGKSVELFGHDLTDVQVEFD